MLSNKIEFASNKEYQAYRSDVNYWWTFINELFERHLQLSNINPGQLRLPKKYLGLSRYNGSSDKRTIDQKEVNPLMARWSFLTKSLL